MANKTFKRTGAGRMKLKTLKDLEIFEIRQDL
ncbi:hypothetical protein LCGC14_2827110, partial [marine sediment metagenome]